MYEMRKYPPTGEMVPVSNCPQCGGYFIGTENFCSDYCEHEFELEAYNKELPLDMLSIEEGGSR